MTDVLSKVMNYIKPFQKYLSPMDAMGTIADSLGGSIPAVGNFFETVNDLKNDSLTLIMETFMDLVAKTCELSGMVDLPTDVEIDLPSINAIENFVDEASINSDFINSLLEGAKNSLDNHSGTLLGLVDLAITAIGVAMVSSSVFAEGLSFSSVGSLIVGSLGALIEGFMLLTPLSKTLSFYLGSLGLGLALMAGFMELIASAGGRSTPTSKVVVGADIVVGFISFYKVGKEYN